MNKFVWIFMQRYDRISKKTDGGDKMANKLRSIFAAVITVVLLLLCGCTESTGENTDFENKIIAVKQYSTVSYAAAEYTQRGAVLEEYESVTDCIRALEAGKCDYVITDEFTAQALTDADSALKIKDIPETVTRYVALFQRDSKLCTEFDESLEALAANGTLALIKNAALNSAHFEKSALTGENGSLIIGTDPIYPPFSFQNSSGEVEGIDIDTANEVCARLGYAAEFYIGSFDDLYAKLQSGEIDFIISANEYAAERTDVSSSQPYYELGYVLIGI